MTHYHPTTTTPFWFRHHPDRTQLIDFGNRGAYGSVHYDLTQKKRAMIAPDSPFMR